MDEYIKGLIIGYRAFTDKNGIYRVFANFVCNYNSKMIASGSYGQQCITISFKDDSARDFIKFIKDNTIEKPILVLGYWMRLNDNSSMFKVVNYKKAS